MKKETKQEMIENSKNAAISVFKDTDIECCFEFSVQCLIELYVNSYIESAMEFTDYIEKLKELNSHIEIFDLLHGCFIKHKECCNNGDLNLMRFYFNILNLKNIKCKHKHRNKN